MEKLTVKGLLVFSFAGACALLTFYLGVFRGETRVYPHLFYIPIILAGVWYRKKAIYVALFLSGVYILVTHYSLTHLSVDVFERSTILIVVAYIIGLVSEKRAQVEAEIVRERDKFQKILSTISEIIFIIDRDFKVLELSKPQLRAGIEMEDGIPRRYRRIPPSQLIERKEVIGKTCYKGFWGKEKICSDCPVPSVFENGKGVRKMGSFVLADGTMMYLDVEYVPVFDEKGNVVQVIGDMRDITEQKRMEEMVRSAEEQLRETRDYLDDIIKSSADAIVVVDMEGIVRSWNKGAEAYMGYTADEVIGRSNKMFFPDPDEAERIMERVLKEGELKNYRTIVLRKDKRPVHISVSAALLKNKNGMPLGTVRVSRDITKEVELERKIKEERDNLNLIFESMPDGVYIVSKDYNVEFMNKVLIDEFGDRVGNICYEVFHGREEPCPLCKNTEVMNRKTVRWEWHSRRKNKTYDLIETPLKNINGTLSKLTIFRDISERKRMEEELRETCKRLAELDKMKLDFLSVAYHEMRSPLAPIIGYASLLEPKLPDKERRYICNIEKCARDLEEMINRMLELARIDGKKVQLTFEELSIPEVVQKVVKKLKPAAEAKNQILSTLIPELTIQADEQKLLAIFTNLISNAIRYTPEGGRIDIMVEERGEDIRGCVADSGPGIPAEHLPKIFERFYMADTSMTRKSGGFGLGLSIVKEYVRLHGGRVWATSEPGKGSKFFFTLPKEK
ncbi:MAG: PAS domain S-box protein [Methanophagales archaeon]|nr:PAS domain S-box protein [Methanophagales archaeon]